MVISCATRAGKLSESIRYLVPVVLLALLAPRAAVHCSNIMEILCFSACRGSLLYSTFQAASLHDSLSSNLLRLTSTESGGTQRPSGTRLVLLYYVVHNKADYRL